MTHIIDEPSSLRALELQPVSSFRLSARAFVHPGINALLVAVLALAAVFGARALLPPDLPQRTWIPGALALAAVVVARSYPATYVVVGADGIFVDTLLYKRFLAYGDIEAVRVGRVLAPSSLLAELEIATTRTRIGLWALRPRRTALASRIAEALESYRQRLPAPDTTGLARGDRPVAQWIRHLRELGEAAAGQSASAPMSIDRLWRIVESPASKPLARAAAAVAISVRLDKPTRERMLAVVRMTASPLTRAALDAVMHAEGDDPIASALEAIGGRGAPATTESTSSA